MKNGARCRAAMCAVLVVLLSGCVSVEVDSTSTAKTPERLTPALKPAPEAEPPKERESISRARKNTGRRGESPRSPTRRQEDTLAGWLADVVKRVENEERARLAADRETAARLEKVEEAARRGSDPGFWESVWALLWPRGCWWLVAFLGAFVGVPKLAASTWGKRARARFRARFAKPPAQPPRV